MKRDVPINLGAMLATVALLFVGLGVSLLLDFRQNEKLSTIKGGVERIELIVKPICVTPGLERECTRQLIAADESRVVQLCKRAAFVLRLSNIRARCVIVGGTSATDEGVVPGQSGSSPGQPGPGDGQGQPGPQGPPGPPGSPGQPGDDALDELCDQINELTPQLPVC